MNQDFAYTLKVEMPLEQPTAGGFADTLALRTRHRMEDLIDERGIGRCHGGGSGLGWMDVSFGVRDLDAGIGQTEALLKELGVRSYVIMYFSDDGPRVVRDTTRA